MVTMSPRLCVNPMPESSRSCVGANIVLKKGMRMASRE
jgi:hypothetical protein